MHRKNFRVYSIVLTMGLLVGSLVGEVLARWLPAGVARDFFTTSVAGAFGPVSIDLVAVALTLGPLTLYVNLMSLVGIIGAAYLYRAFF
ncbi:MAG TPA: DUF4321 domain-containing protein [Gemmatimonadota bacterium]|jgi:hypothetical protein|nr:DUF4321 domain-containing protein [Gemmatimonadota bacterium]